MQVASTVQSVTTGLSMGHGIPNKTESKGGNYAHQEYIYTCVGHSSVPRNES